MLNSKNSSDDIFILPINHDYPYRLLLLADPSQELVDSYLDKGLCFIAKLNESVVGVVVLLKTHIETFEIMNIAVHENYQRKGIGEKLISFAIEEAKKRNAKFVEIATGNSSLHQLALYQKIGFSIHSIDKNFFLKNYQEPIFENKIKCKDSILLRMSVK